MTWEVPYGFLSTNGLLRPLVTLYETSNAFTTYNFLVPRRRTRKNSERFVAIVSGAYKDNVWQEGEKRNDANNPPLTFSLIYKQNRFCANIPVGKNAKPTVPHNSEPAPASIARGGLFRTLYETVARNRFVALLK